MNNTLIVSATRRSENCSIPLLESLKEFTSIYGDYNYEIIWNNTNGLPKVYNRYLNDTYFDRYTCILFVHDDVYIDDLKCFEKIHNQFSQDYSVVGLAGGQRVEIKRPALWHLMTDRKSQSGAVAHPHGERTYVTSFGPTPVRCLIMDGLFLAIDCSKFKSNPVKFDESFMFHHYDLDFCLQCNAKKHKLVTEQINVIHQSPGLLDAKSKSFEQSESKFILKYAKN